MKPKIQSNVTGPEKVSAYGEVSAYERSYTDHEAKQYRVVLSALAPRNKNIRNLTTVLTNTVHVFT